MSKKNIARSAIEGGRYKYNKYKRRNSHRKVRASERDYCNKAEYDSENIDSFEIRVKDKVYKDFRDKLAPMYRWLASQVGRAWNDVFSEITQKFDTRTTAGRHIVYDHLLSSVEITPRIRRKYESLPVDPYSSHYNNDFYVDNDGILCKKQYIPRGHYSDPLPKFDTVKFTKWLNGRIVAQVGNKFFWFVSTAYSKSCCAFARISTYINGIYYFNLGVEYIYDNQYDYKNRIIIGEKPFWNYDSMSSVRQFKKLSKKELEYWNSVPEPYQKMVTSYSPFNKELRKNKDWYFFSKLKYIAPPLPKIK